MKRIFEGRKDEDALWAATWVMADLLSIKGISPHDAALVRTIACDSTYRQVLSGAEEKTFVTFPETNERQPDVYKTLTKLGYIAVPVIDRLSQDSINNQLPV